MNSTQRSKERRQRRLFAAIAGWALLGAASTGIVACSSADAAGTSAAASSVAAASSPAAGSPGTSSPAAGSTAASSSAVSSSSSASTTSSAAAATDPSAGAAASTAEPAATGEYADGIYTAVGTYSSPGGEESISVTLTLTGDVVTAASAVGNATSPPSSQYQQQFVSNFADLIVGKSLDEVALDKVAGSSLTPIGFNDAVDTIKTDALA
jgi:hypothetical protein